MPKFTVLCRVNARIMRPIGPRRMVERQRQRDQNTFNVTRLWLQFADNKKPQPCDWGSWLGSDEEEGVGQSPYR